MVRGDDTFPIERAAARAIDRRRFLGMAAVAAAAVAAGEWLTRQIGRAAPLAVALPDPASLAVGEARAVVAAGGREALVVKLASGAVVAYDRRCPHLGCPVLWAPERGRFECPCHRAAFDAATGRVLFGPPQSGLEPVQLGIRGRSHEA